MIEAIIIAGCGLLAGIAVLVNYLLLACAPVIDDDTIAQRDEGGPK